jgi:hypothetical protein
MQGLATVAAVLLAWLQHTCRHSLLHALIPCVVAGVCTAEELGYDGICDAALQDGQYHASGLGLHLCPDELAVLLQGCCVLALAQVNGGGMVGGKGRPSRAC